MCKHIAQNSSRCPFYTFQGYANLTGVAPSRDMYWFVLVNCNKTGLNVEVPFPPPPRPSLVPIPVAPLLLSLSCCFHQPDPQFYEVFLNPNNQYLGWDTIPLPYLYGILIIVYSFLFLAWIANIFMVDYVRHPSSLPPFVHLHSSVPHHPTRSPSRAPAAIVCTSISRSGRS